MQEKRILSTLTGPLLFAAKNNFAGIERIRGLEKLVTTKAEAAVNAGEVEINLLEELKVISGNMDSLATEEKKKAVCKIIECLGKYIVLPEKLLAITAVGSKKLKPRSSEGKRKKTSAPESSPSASDDPDMRFETDPGLYPLNLPVSSFHGIGPGRAAALATRGIYTFGDLLRFIPVSYEKSSNPKNLGELNEGHAKVSGTVTKVSDKRVGKKRRRLFEAVISDGKGTLKVKYFHAGPWLPQKYKVGAKICISGKISLGFDRIPEMVHPVICSPDNQSEDSQKGKSRVKEGCFVMEPGRERKQSPVKEREIISRYSEIEGMPRKSFEELLKKSLLLAQKIIDPLPPEIIVRRQLPHLGEALSFLHLPPDETDIQSLLEKRTPAHRRLVYGELFFLQLALALKAKKIRSEAGFSFPIENKDIEEAINLLPFEPTVAQLRTVREIAGDMAGKSPMHRLLQGDVGSGKTAVAITALALAARAGIQSAVMAPTELLADQHYKTLRKFLEPAGISVILLTGKLRAAEKRSVLEKIAKGRGQVIVGTHALIQEGVSFSCLGLVIIDEQHRFGVRQRMNLAGKGRRPDLLVMTATPIPRTLAMTVYGDLDLSVIDEMPPGRKSAVTRLVKGKLRDDAWREILNHLADGRQAYVIYPIVDASEHLEDVKAAVLMCEELKIKVFPDYRVELLHGKMQSRDKEIIMNAFAAGEVNVLVATTVVEVGIDVPNASVMVIEHAERYGLSQLHQLRGRVGRGSDQSFCYLFSDSSGENRARERLQIMCRTCDGFRIAEEDLKIRGPGEALGTRQSGRHDLLFGDPAGYAKLLSMARADAFAIADADPSLSETVHNHLAEELSRQKGMNFQEGSG